MPLFNPATQDAPLLRGLRGLSATNYYDITGDTALKGNATGFEIIIAFIMDTSGPATAVDQYVISGGAQAVGGWRTGFAESNLLAQVTNGGGSAQGLNATGYWDLKGKALVVMSTGFDGTDRFTRLGGKDLQRSAMTGFTADPAGVRLGGQFDGVEPVVDGCTIIALGAKTDGVLTDAAWEAQMRALVTTGDFIDGTLTNRWSFKTLTLGAAPATISDAIGSNTFSRTGSMTIVDEGDTGSISWFNKAVFGSLAYVDDAPSNGTTYGRKNNAWDAVGASAAPSLARTFLLMGG